MPETVHGGSAAAVANEPPLRATLDPLGEALMEAAGEAKAALALADPVTAVHELRKAFKRLRALLRLVRRETCGREDAVTARALRRQLGEGARRLSGARDIAARREAMDDLVAKGLLTPALRRTAGRALLGKGQAAGDAGLATHREELAALIAASEDAASRLNGSNTIPRLLRVMAEEYTLARKLGRKAHPDEPESLHDLRKAVVAHRYQMALVTTAWPAVGRVWEVELQRLREKLGKFQDLAVLLEPLAQEVPEGRAAPGWSAPLAEAARARQLKLVASALRLHARLFAEKPGAFRRRLAAYFDPVSVRE